MAGQITGFLASWGPLWFGLGFLAPLVAQSMDAMSIPAPFGLSTIVFGLLLGSTAGLVAKRRGSWI
jgi:hypothetical protein